MENNQTGNVIIVHVTDLVRTLIKRIWIVILSAVIFAVGGYAYAYITSPTPMYATTTKLYVTGIETATPSTSGFSLGRQVINNYIEIMESRPVLETVIENLGLNMSYSDMLSCISSKVPTDTCMLEITVSFPDPEWAKVIADELVVISGTRALEIMGSSPPTVYDAAYVPTRAYNTSGSTEIKYALLGGAGGAALVLFMLCVCYFANTKLDPDKVTDRLKLKLVGMVPNGGAKNQKYKAAAFNSLYSRLKYVAPESKVIAFLGVTGKEKKAETIADFAETLAALGKKVVCVDTNLCNPSWGSDDTEKKGLQGYLTGKLQLQDIIGKKDAVDNISCGGTAVNSIELLAEEKFTSLLQELETSYDYVLIDTAPLSYVQDAFAVAKAAEKCVFVLSAKTDRIGAVKENLAAVEEQKIGVAVAVLKDVNVKKGGKYFLKKYGTFFGVYKG